MAEDVTPCFNLVKYWLVPKVFQSGSNPQIYKTDGRNEATQQNIPPIIPKLVAPKNMAKFK